MFSIHRRPRWRMTESAATPEGVFLSRRRLIGTAIAGAGAAGLGISFLGGDTADAQGVMPLPEFRRNDAFKLDRTMTTESVATGYNNFVEFGSTKRVNADKLRLRPWAVKVDGLCNAPFEMEIDDLLKAMPIEERLYRHRCVETWAMAVPWVGFALAALVKKADPRSDAKYLKLETFLDPTRAPYQRDRSRNWPYVEGLTLAEATNDLAFMAIGAYGKPLAKQQGAPLRLAVPWKYGFKSIKSVMRFSFTAERPRTFWEDLQPDEYGFWANVNPKVDHERWSQASEYMLGTYERRPTLLFNGYAEDVAHLYKGLEGEKLYM